MFRHYNPNEIGVEAIIDFLTRCSSEYPDEVGNVDLKEWPEKMNRFADAFCYLDEHGTISAAIFFYCNDLKNKTAYVTFFCSLHGTPKGTAYQLHKNYLDYSKTKGMFFSRLEVLKNNAHARAFYERQGYRAIEDHGKKDLLLLELTKTEESHD